MNGAATNTLEAIQPCFDASSSRAAWGSADARVRLFDVSSSSIAADITGDLADGSISDKNISKSVFSCLVWGQGKVRIDVRPGNLNSRACSECRGDGRRGFPVHEHSY